ncbi:LysR family transcriptional regulator [Jannaschia ovalis]|uniref:LysR family transcriptional regulator n=1 Tax=Jannaschia ovalis TaxID=3038773 RepID=A0ABY8LEI5_9RHOB|nr:LysR family transcriptional regulator [Jannaschia sp. GRR-S6-38]WGH78485.1 LysR family transcriptional regulator [Jannaschia sp. GRR-S6-38]
MTIENWDDLKYVLAVQRHGTMSAAARFLTTNVATVSRRIDRITQELGRPLFEKRGKSLVGTPAARRLADLAEAIDQRLRAELAQLHSGATAAPVTLEIAAPPAVHTHYILPRIGDLMATLPSVSLTLTDKAFAQGLGEADLQIRLGRPEGGRLRARKFRDVPFRVYHRKDRPLNGDWVTLTHRYPGSDILRSIYPEARAEPRLRVEDLRLVHRMVQETGLAGFLPGFLIEPGDGLVAAELPDNLRVFELWIAYHETRHGDPLLRSVVDWFCEPAAAAA